MTLRGKLAVRYATVVVACLLLLAGLAWHEFVNEPELRRQLGIPESPENFWIEIVEVFFYAMIPVVFGVGWWGMRRTLLPISTLAEAVERVQADNLREPLPRTFDRDETDRLTEVFNAMIARLDQSFRQIREFTLHASHELKTPLTIMRVQLETMLQDERSLLPEHRDWAECQLNEVERLAKIVSGLTLLSKADAGQITLEQKVVKLDELVRESFEDARILAEPDGVRVTLTECASAQTLGDRNRLRQVLLNLTDNAIKYNRPNGLMTIALRNTKAVAEIEVTNTGDGLPPELQARLFQRFVRGDEARRRAIEGCGLGLSICRWIVHAHNGSIQLSSEPGKQTTVLVRIPLQ
jgi:signal transduction histidine kinase